MSLKLDGKKLSLEIEGRLNDYISSNKCFSKVQKPRKNIWDL